MKRLLEKKVIMVIVCSLLALALAGCAKSTETDYVAAIMVEGEIYCKTVTAMPAEIDESAILGYTKSYTDTFPEKDGETNFNRKLGMPYAKVEDGVAVLMDNEWYLCVPLDATLLKGSIEFYSEPTKEGTDPVSVTTKVLSSEQIRKIQSIIEEVEEWTDDHSVDRLAYYFDGEITLSTQEYTYYFSYEHDVLYYDHYFAEISGKDMNYIKDIGGEE